MRCFVLHVDMFLFSGLVWGNKRKFIRYGVITGLR